MLTGLISNLQAEVKQSGSLNLFVMKKVIFLLLIINSVTIDAQSLKDALFSGKLKSDSSKLIRKTDDLSKVIDTAARKPVDSVKAVKTMMATDSASATKSTLMNPGEPPVMETTGTDSKPVIPKDNDEILKEFADTIISTLNTEVIPDRKIKSGSYFVLLNYEIGTDGQFAVNNVTVNPENSFLQEQVKERFNLFAPKMNPIFFNGNPRKVLRKYNFTLSKK